MVVKPIYGSLSKHTTCNIQNDYQLQDAIKIAKIINREFIVKEYIEGSVHRITVVNNNVIASCWREQPSITGDGKHTVQELINIKNKNPLRGGGNHQKNFTLHRITPTKKTESLLATQNLKYDSVLIKKSENLLA